ncbi:MAG TPA: MarC family protein [Candidatus Nanopelagicaceae bacterium]
MTLASAGALTFALQAFVTLFVIMDPPGAIPIFLVLVADKDAKVRRRLALQAAAVSFFVISIFALFGRFILDYLNISMAALQAAGGLLLLLISLELLTGRGTDPAQSKDSNIALVPLGTPLLAGPGAIVATMVFAQRVHNPSHAIGLVVAVIAVHVAIAVALLTSTTILRVIRQAGVTLVARIAGLLLAAIAVQMIVDAIKVFTSTG